MNTMSVGRGDAAGRCAVAHAATSENGSEIRNVRNRMKWAGWAVRWESAVRGRCRMRVGYGSRQWSLSVDPPVTGPQVLSRRQPRREDFDEEVVDGPPDSPRANLVEHPPQNGALLRRIGGPALLAERTLRRRAPARCRHGFN